MTNKIDGNERRHVDFWGVGVGVGGWVGGEKDLY